LYAAKCCVFVLLVLSVHVAPLASYSLSQVVRTIRLFAGRISTIVYISIFPAFDDDVIK